MMYKHFFKRLFDFLISLVALLLIGWFLIIVAIWLHFANKGAGAFFTQNRPGKDAKIFKVIKFTGCGRKSAPGRAAPDQGREVRAQYEHRRVTAAHQRTQGGHGPDRAAPAAAAIPAAVFARTGAPARSAAGHLRLGAVPRAECNQLDGEI